MYKVLLSAPYMQPYVTRFSPLFVHYDVELIIPKVNERLSEEEILPYAGQFDGAVCGDDRFNKRVLQACAPRLKVISKWGTGIDSIDKIAAENLGIRVFNTPGAFTVPVSDSVMAYILVFARKLPWMDKQVKLGYWKKISGVSLSESTLGVIGVGRIGKAVVQKATVFGMTLLGNDIRQPDSGFLASNPVEMVSLEQLLARADFISLNTDLNPTSHHLINAHTIRMIKRGSVLINTSRGPVVDEAALISALQEGILGGAGLDVFEDEPLPADSPLKLMDNVLLAPHNSNSSPAAWERVHWNTIGNLLTGLDIPHPDLGEWESRI